jgi:hypothetical protein
MPERYFQVEGDDGCVYFYDYEKDAFKKICDIGNFTNDIPLNVREKFKAEQERQKTFVKYNL